MGGARSSLLPPHGIWPGRAPGQAAASIGSSAAAIITAASVP